MMKPRVDDALTGRRRFALLWLFLAILLATLTPIVAGLLFAFLIPVLFFFAAVMETPPTYLDDAQPVPRLIVLPAFSPRPPPIF